LDKLTCYLIPENGLFAKIEEPKTHKKSLNKALQKLSTNRAPIATKTIQSNKHKTRNEGKNNDL